MATICNGHLAERPYGWPPVGSHRDMRTRFVRAMAATDGGRYTGGRPYPGKAQHGIRVDAWGWHLDPVRVVRGSRRR
jgi:hypothetical protein